MITGVPLVEVERSGFVESVHTGHLIALDAAGNVARSLGSPDQPVFPRSSNKPLQAVALLRLGVDLDDAQVALTAASHSGEAMHLDVVRSTLAAAGLTADDLACPPDWPAGEAAREAAIAAGAVQERLFMNCSGKHAAMLATCRVQGWPTVGYLAADHPLQLAIRATVEELAGPVFAVGVDGCGAPLFALTLTGLARAFASLATATDGAEHRVATAMRAYPHLVGGTDRAVTALMQAEPGLIAKDGAEGVYAAALPDGSTVAVKIDDGAGRAAEQAVAQGLRVLGATTIGALPVLGGGAPVGEIRPVF